jgi:hypothetical protein
MNSGINFRILKQIVSHGFARSRACVAITRFQQTNGFRKNSIFVCISGDCIAHEASCFDLQIHAKIAHKNENKKYSGSFQKRHMARIESCCRRFNVGHKRIDRRTLATISDIDIVQYRGACCQTDFCATHLFSGFRRSARRNGFCLAVFLHGLHQPAASAGKP